MKAPELLVPAGNLEKLRTALLYGADAVYTGVEGLSLRTDKAEFTFDDLAIGVKEAHEKGVRVYAALNTFARNNDLKYVAEAVQNLSAMEIDGVIISDPGVLQVIKETKSRMTIHLSTQANTTNTEAIRFWRQQGVERIVLARELRLKEIAEIAQAVPEMEIELFIHGAMCMAYSGRCFLSAALTGRSANRGECTHPSRWEYQLQEKTRPGEPFILEEDGGSSGRYSYILSSKDLCMIDYLPEILAAGVSSLKIEGRMKSVYYVAAVTRVYRWALDAARSCIDARNEEYQVKQEWREELGKVSNRGYTTGFYLTETEMINETNPDSGYEQTHGLVGTVLAYDEKNGRLRLKVRNLMENGDCLELLLPDRTVTLDSKCLTDLEGNPITRAHNGYEVFLRMRDSCFHIPEGAVVRKFRG